MKSAQWRVCVSRRLKFRLKTVRSEEPRLLWVHYSLCIARTKLCWFALYRSDRLVNLRTVRSFSMSACYYRFLILFHLLDCLHSLVEALFEWTFLSKGLSRELQQRKWISNRSRALNSYLHHIATSSPYLATCEVCFCLYQILITGKHSYKIAIRPDLCRGLATDPGPPTTGRSGRPGDKGRTRGIHGQQAPQESGYDKGQQSVSELTAFSSCEKCKPLDW